MNTAECYLAASEIKSGKFVVKNIGDKSQEKIPINNICEYLINRLKQ